MGIALPTYEVRVGAFSGPMDLLLYLVQKNELKPSEISIAEITDQYLEWIKDLEKADLSLAGDFLLMASRLMALKVRELLPRDQQSEVEQLEFDQDREALIRQMLEYHQFKVVANGLRQLEENNIGTFYRGRLERARSQEDSALAEIGVYHLYKAFRKSIKAHRNDPEHTIELDEVTIEDRQQHIGNLLVRQGRALFEELLGRDRRPMVAAVTFMAILEMVKTEDVIFRQSEPLGVLWLYRRRNNVQHSEEMARDVLLQTPDPTLKPGLSDFLRQRQEALESRSQLGLDDILREVGKRVEAGDYVPESKLQELIDKGVEQPQAIDVVKRLVGAADQGHEFGTGLGIGAEVTQ